MEMKARNFKVFIGALFMFIFITKMAVAFVPVLFNLDGKDGSAVTLQLEHDSKTEKDDPEKDAFKEKKIFDETYLHSLDYLTFLAETEVLYNLEHSLFKQVYHPVVPTPPPNA